MSVASCSALLRLRQTMTNSCLPCLPFQTVYFPPRPIATRTFPMFCGISYRAISETTTSGVERLPQRPADRAQQDHAQRRHDQEEEQHEQFGAFIRLIALRLR